MKAVYQLVHNTGLPAYGMHQLPRKMLSAPSPNIVSTYLQPYGQHATIVPVMLQYICPSVHPLSLLHHRCHASSTSRIDNYD